MSKKMTVLHRIIFLMSILILASSLVFFLIKWNGLPDAIGIHFASDGSFDVEAEKFFGFYPHLAGGILIAIFAAAHFLINKVKTGIGISSEGEKLFKTEFHFTLDILSVLLSLFFANWSRCVSLQVPLNVDTVRVLTAMMLAVGAAGIISGIVTYQKHKTQKESAAGSGRFHSICRLIAWMLTAAGIAVLAVMWDRLPTDEVYYFDPEYYGLAYFADLGAYLDRRLLLIPHGIIVVLLAVLEVISVKAGKANKAALVALTDRSKLIGGVFFFWWNILLANESGIGIVSPCLFISLYAVSFIIYFIQKKRKG